MVEHKKICVVLHLYYHDLWEEFKDKIITFDNINIIYDLFISLTESHNNKIIIQKIKHSFPNAIIFELPNKGLDIGPFFYSLNYIFENNLTYDLVLKIHSKKSPNNYQGPEFGHIWRKQTVDSLIGSEEKLKTNLLILKNKRIGMVGCEDFFYDGIKNNELIIDEFCKEMKIDKRGVFFAGTMFFVKFKILKKYFRYNSMEIYNSLEEGYSSDEKEGTKTHSLERIFAYIVYSYNKKVIGV